VPRDPIGEQFHLGVQPFDPGVEAHSFGGENGADVVDLERLHAEHPDMPRDLIETHVFGWLENCAPESYTDEQMEEFDQLMEPWLEDYERKRSAGGK
jgi:hypothetical protein